MRGASDRVVPGPALPAASPRKPGAATAPFSEQDARRLGPVRRWFWRHPVASDWLVTVSFVALVTLATQLGTSIRHPLVLAALILLAGTTLLVRRRLPLPVLAVVTAIAVAVVLLTGGLNGTDLAIALAVYAVAAATPSRHAWAALAGALGIVTAAILLADTAAYAGELAGLGVITFAAMAIGSGVRNRRLHIRELLERGNALARETDHRARLATVEERARIAREMHDVVAHSLSVMIALADGAAASIDRSPASARTAIGAVSTTGRAALSDMRRVLGVLRDGEASVGPPPGGLDLEELVQSFRTAGLPVDLVVAGTPLPDDTGLQLAVYRIVQESLTNALRHTGGSGSVVARVAHTAGTVTIEVTDDGGLSHTVRLPTTSTPLATATGRTRGATPSGGRGLIGMRERAAIYDGSVEAGPSGTGWRVSAALHVDQLEEP